MKAFADQKNPLLVKHFIGQGRQATHDLPDKTHAYGRQSYQEKYHVNSLLNEWDTYKGKRAHGKHTLSMNEADFTKINKKAIKDRVDTKNYREYRQSVDVKVVPKYESRLSASKVFQDITTEHSAYGKPTRAQTPMKGLINGDVGNAAEQHFEMRASDHQTLVSYLILSSVCESRGERLAVS